MSRRYVAVILAVLCVLILLSALSVRYEPEGQLEQCMQNASSVRFTWSTSYYSVTRTVTGRRKIHTLAHQISSALLTITDDSPRAEGVDGGSDLQIEFLDGEELLCRFVWLPEEEHLIQVCHGSAMSWYVWSGSRLLQPYYQSLRLRLDAAWRAENPERCLWP